ncbi:class I SAM-dependent methyltransferase [Methylobacterium platani]|uniref:class I SAM-dependent methyltransferase n=1 Tax=Methylobacterium platani TaxID=427683 RepID=UPI001FD72C7B|nr:class I SAM-dependent methyltransferase [Methylobacterium platani]
MSEPAGVTFAADLPLEPGPVVVEVLDGDVLLGRATVEPSPRRNAYGLDAEQVQAVYGRPLFSAPWMQFDGARLTVSGYHLPPDGDPGRLSVRLDEGVAYTFDYPVRTPEFGHHFWYWPNAELSSFILTIDLPACRAGSDPFWFEFVYPGMDAGLEALPEAVRRARRRISVPSRLDAAVCFPRDTTQLTRVQTWSTDQSVTVTGYGTYRTLEALFAQYGVGRRAGIEILDWGCGHGRIARHFVQNWPEARITGADIDAENAGWCARHLDGRFVTVPLLPPTGLPAASFDGIFGVSVMTHLTAEAQDAWLAEIARLLKPGGVALITFSGPAATAYTSVFRSPDWWQAWCDSGFDDSQHDPALDGKIGDDSYYRNTLHSPDYTLKVWSRHLEVVDIVPSAIGYQDVAVLRRRT